MKHIDLNADLAEGMKIDKALLSLVSSASISCGVHAGNPVHIRNALNWAKEQKVRVGAHPSFPDRENFGRTPMQIDLDDLIAHLHYQLGALKALCDSQGVDLEYVKPHGALYNQAAKDLHLASTIAQTIKKFDPKLKLMGLSGGLLLRVGEEIGLQTISEVFADRRYQSDGTLVSRTQPNAQVETEEEAIKQVLEMVKKGSVNSIEGVRVSVRAESVCIHGDGQHALNFAKKIRETLKLEGIQVSHN